jgi:hypothetical protein
MGFRDIIYSLESLFDDVARKEWHHKANKQLKSAFEKGATTYDDAITRYASRQSRGPEANCDMLAYHIYNLEKQALMELPAKLKEDRTKLEQQRESAWNRRNDRRGACMAIYR